MTTVRVMSQAVLKITLPLANADGAPVTLDDALAVWNSLLRTVAACGLIAEGAHCDFEGVES